MSLENEKLSLRRETDWLCVIFNLQIFISFICAIHFVIFEAYILTTAFSLVLVLLAILGVTAGSHRLWAHKSYEATTSLKIFLMLCQTLAGHTSIYDWVLLHRLHHQRFRTELDPFSPAKGFVYSHFICNNLKLSSYQKKLLEEIDMSDIEKDKVVMFQKKYYWILFLILTLLLPINAPVEYWNESIPNSLFIAGWLRFSITYHLSLLIHTGSNIFDYGQKNRNEVDNYAMLLFDKSYWISYHYLTPWDYQASEYGKYGTDCVSKFIRVCAALEFAFDLRTLESSSLQHILATSVKESKSFSECVNKMDCCSFDKTQYRNNYLRVSKYH